MVGRGVPAAGLPGLDLRPAAAGRAAAAEHGEIASAGAGVLQVQRRHIGPNLRCGGGTNARLGVWEKAKPKDKQPRN